MKSIKLVFPKVFLTALIILSIGFSVDAQTFPKVAKVDFRYNTSPASKSLYVRTNAISMTCMDPQPLSTVKKATLYAVLNWKGDYDNNPGNNTEYTVALNILAYSSYTGTTGLLATYTPTVVVNTNSPQSYVAIDFTGLHSTVNRFLVTATYTPTGTVNPDVQAVIQTDVYYSEEFEYNVTNNISGPMIQASSVTFNGNEAKFVWVNFCGVPAPNHQFQLLRLYNKDVTKTTNEADINADLDWSKALTIETGNSLEELTLTLAEGTGYYIWRVRPIGNAYEGGIANDLNWGLWTTTGGYVQGGNYNITNSYVSSTMAGVAYLIYYVPPASELGRNWIFSRNFIQGDGTNGIAGQVNIAEGISYANGLQMIQQSQTKIKSSNKIIANQVIYDFSGRAALSTLSAPVGNSTLGYISNYIRNTSSASYSASDFDTDINYNSPAVFDSTSIGPGNYYSNLNEMEAEVPTASGYPFRRTLYMKNGTSKPKEQSGPGLFHKLGNSAVNRHTTRNYISSVSEIELITIFGDEAPDAKGVLKSITTDANGESTISYISKEGQIIATCLSAPGATNLDALPSVPASPLTVDYYLDNNSSYGINGLIASKSIVLTEPTTVYLSYALTPNVYEDNCIPFCATCDYLVTIKIINDDDPAAAPLYTFTKVVNPTQGTSSCAGSPVTDLITPVSTLLPAGSFTVQRTIESNQINTSTPPTTTPLATLINTPYIDQYLISIENTLRNNFSTGTATIVDDFGVPIVGAPSVSMTSLMAYFNVPYGTQPNMAGLFSLLNVTTQDHVNLKVGCDIINIPISYCPSSQCPPGNDFEQYLIDWCTANGLSYSTVAAKIIPGYSTGQFNTVIANMIDPTCGNYNCEALFACWKTVISMYESLEGMAGTSVSGSSGGFTMPSGTYTPDYLDLFLDCAGYKIKGINTNVGALGCSNPGYKFHPYAYLNYTSGNRCIDCEKAFYAIINGNLATYPYPNPGDLSLFVAYFNTFTAVPYPVVVTNSTGTVTVYPKEIFQECIKICNTTGTVPTTSAFESSTENTCKATCEERYGEFVNLITQEYHRAGKYVEGDLYTLVLDTDLNYYVFSTTSYNYLSGAYVTYETIYCQAQQLVEACKSYCVLTVTTTSGQTVVGTSTEHQNMANAMYGAYDVALPDGSNNCPATYFSTATTSLPAANFMQYVVNVLNLKLGQLRADAPIDGFYWDYRTFLERDVNSYFVASGGCSATNKFIFIHPNIPSYFDFESGGSPYNLTYYFNKQPAVSSGISTKSLYSIGLISPASPFNSPGFNYIAAPTKTGSQALTDQLVDGKLGYYMPSGFSAIATSALTTSPLDITSVYNAGTIGAATTLYKYILSTATEHGYYKYVLCTSLGSGNVDINCGKICYKITSPTVVTTNSVLFQNEGNSYLDVTCAQESLSGMENSFNSQLASIISNESAKIKALYHQRCIDELVDQVKVSYGIKYHHYTLLYYDRAGNLVKTVPPRGVVLGATTRATHPLHTMVTEYAYNSLGQFSRQKTPDGGESFFWYDEKSRLRFSQNAKQLANAKMSYTKYDYLGRIFEVGEMPQSSTPLTDANIPTYPTTGMADITYTVYTSPASGILYFGGKAQRYLQNRVSYSYSDRDGSVATLGDRIVTYYSYDPHGNVEWLIQDIPELGRNYIAYEYDLIGGTVVKVKYNEEFPDKFFHKYSYDIDKRIKIVETSKDNVYWEKEADYSYYIHGPLKRAEIGQDKIQGLDYVYTIQGWLKGMNHVDFAYDMGKDGNETGNSYIPKDIYSFGLGYYKGDFISKSSRYNSEVSNPNYLIAAVGRDLYNGNISTWTSKYDIDAMNVLDIALPFQDKDKVTGRTFKYDELNRVKEAQYNVKNPTWATTNNYFENFTYDANGNIQTLTRKGYGINAAEQKMDIMAYNYYAPTVNNKLQNVTDTDDNAVPARYQDIKTQTAFPSNYSYDLIGNLTADGQEGITSIQWNVYGKISKILKLVGGVNQTIEFLYDASGKRVSKKVYDHTLPNPEISAITTYYVLDAGGNSLAIYERTNQNAGPYPNYMANFDLKEQPIYGSDRIGERILDGVILRQVPFAYPATPAPQNLPSAVHISAWPKMILPLGNTAASQLYTKKLNTNSTTNVAADLGVNELTISAGAGATAAHGRNQAVMMDEVGNVILTAYTYSRSISPTTVSKIYSYSKTLLINSDLINSNPACQSLFVKRPGSTGEYYYFTIGTDNKPYYHIIDLTTGYVTSYNNLIDNSATYGQAMAVIDDRLGQGVSTLYLKSYSGGTTTIKVFSINANSVTLSSATPVTFTSAATTGAEGEIQVSSDGLKMAVANTVGTTGEVRVYSIGADHQTLASLGKITLAATTTARYVEFTASDARIYFTQRTGTTTNAVYRVQTSLFVSSGTSLTMASATSVTSTTTSTIGAIRKGSNSNIYYTTNTTAVPNTLNIHMITAVDGTPVVGAANAIATVITNGSLPVQPHVIDYELPTAIDPIYARTYKQKMYEIKDHLGNVHATLYDYKIPVTDANVKWDKRFDNNTTEGFAVLAGSPVGTVVDNVNNQLRIFGTLGSAANVLLNTTVLPATLGNRYVLSFDYVPSTASSASYTISTTGSTLSTTGFLNSSGRYTIPFVLPSGTTGTNISFKCEDAAASKTFYIDNVLIKSVASTLADGIVILNQTGVVPVDWIGNNGTVALTTSTVTFSNASSVTTASVAKDMVFVPGLVYKATFTLNATGVGTGTPQITMGYLDNDNAPIDYKTFIRSTTGSAAYEFYFIPKTPQGTISFNYDNGTAQPFSFAVTNLVVTQYENQSKSLYTSSITSLQDYYSFGMQMSGRGYVGNAYRYGFGGQEKDDEIKGNGNSYTAEFWEYDPRLGRRWNIDPIAKPWESPFAAFANNPIYFSDPSGLTATGPPKHGDIKKSKNEDGTETTFTYEEDLGWQCPTVEVVSNKNDFPYSGSSSHPESSPVKPPTVLPAWAKVLKGTTAVLDLLPITGDINVLRKTSQSPAIKDGPGPIDLDQFKALDGIGQQDLNNAAFELIFSKAHNDIEEAQFFANLEDLSRITDYNEFAEKVMKHNNVRNSSDGTTIILIYTDYTVQRGNMFYSAHGLNPTTGAQWKEAFIGGDAYGDWKPKFAIWGLKSEFTGKALPIRGVIKIDY